MGAAVIMCYHTHESKFLGSEVIVPRIESRGIFYMHKGGAEE